MDTQILQEIGFTRGEIKVYFALLELGESSIGPLARKSNVTLSKTYPILDKLKEKGLVTYIIKSGTKFFQAFNPYRIINYLDDKKKRIDEKQEEIKKILPQIIAKQKKEAEQSATIYETFNGIKTLYNEILKYLKESKEDFIGFTLGDEYLDKQVNIFFKNYDAKRKALRIKTKLIALKSQKKFLQSEYGKNPNIEIRYISHALPAGTIIFADKVATLVWGKTPTAFVIQSKQAAKAYKEFFLDLWKIAKP